MATIEPTIQSGPGVSRIRLHSASGAVCLLYIVCLTSGCGKRSENKSTIYLSEREVVVEEKQVQQDKQVAQVPETIPAPQEAPTPEAIDPLADYDVSVVRALEGGLNHFAGLLEVPYGRIYRHILHNEAQNTYPGVGNSDQQRIDIAEILDRFSSMGLIRFSEVDLQREYNERHAGKILKPLEINHGPEYNVSITWKAHANLVKEMSTPYKVYVRNYTAKVTSIVKDVEYTSSSLSASEDYRLLVGTAEMHPNSGLFERNYIPPMTVIKFRVILHQNPITRSLSPLSVDIGDPTSSEWYTNRIPSGKYGSPYDLTTIVPPPEPVGEPEPSFVATMQAAQDRLGRNVSPSGNYTLEKIIVNTRGREFFQLSDRDGEPVWGEPMPGPLGEVHWGPDEKAVAFHEGVGDAVEGVWVLRMDPPGLVKGITDEFSALLNKMAEEKMAPTAAGLTPDAEDMPEAIRTKIVGWEDANTLRLRVVATYLPSDKILEMDALLDVTKEGAQAIHFPALPVESEKNETETKTQPPDEWKSLISSGLHDSESMEINFSTGMVSFGTSWMVRMGARQAVGRFDDVDWERAKIVEEVDGGAFKWSVLIEIPLKPDAAFLIKNWTPSPEQPEKPWEKGINPDNAKKSGASLHVYAMNLEASESVLSRIHAIAKTKGAIAEDAGAAKEGCQAPEWFVGEVYPQTRWALLEDGEFANLSETELGHAINEMFARHGATFGRAEVAALFDGKPWYKPDPNVTFEQIEKEKFTDVERANLLKLAELRKMKKDGK